MSLAPPPIPPPCVTLGSRLPPWWVGLIFAFFAAFAILGQVFAQAIAARVPLYDGAASNIGSLIFSFFAFMTLYIWFVWWGGYTDLTRRIGFLIPIMAIFVAVACLRYEGVDGYMKPKFAFRWQPRSESNLMRRRTLEVTASANNVAAGYGANRNPTSTPNSIPSTPVEYDLATETPDDFPQFLGPRRDNRVLELELRDDWKTNPPREIWRQEVGPGWAGFVARNGYAVTIEQQGEEEWITCYRIADGKLVWHHAAPGRHREPLGGLGPRATPAIDSGLVFAQGATGLVRCLNAKTGELVWQDDLLKRFGLTRETPELTQAAAENLVKWGRAGSPLVVDNLVIFPAGGLGSNLKSLVAYDKSTGQVVWEAGNDQLSYTSPTVATLGGVKQVLYTSEMFLTAYDLQDGKMLWQFDWPGSSTADANVSQPVPYDGNHVFQSKGYASGSVVLEIANKGNEFAVTPVWESKRVLKTKFTNVSIMAGHAYGLSDGVLECVDLETGKSKWRKGRYGHGQMIGLQNQLLVLGEGGELYLVAADPQKFQELGKIQALAGKSWNSLCITGNRLLLRNGEEAACFEIH